MLSVLVALLILAGAIGSIYGCACLIRPRYAYASSRWFALPLLFSLLGLGGVGMVISPDSGNRPAAETQQSGIILFVFWMALWWMARSMAKRSRLKRQRAEQHGPHKPGFVARSMAKFKADMAKAEARHQADKARKEQERLKKEQAEKAWLIAEQNAFGIRRAEAARQEPPTHTLIPQSRKKSPPPKPAITYDQSAPRNDGGDVAHFIYVDADGVVTEREVLNWSSDEKLLKGFCTSRRMPRQFRLDRIDTWISG